MPRYGRVIQVTNVTPSATKEQMQELFGFLGPVESIKLVPDPDLGNANVVSRACFVLYEKTESCSLALHLTNTVFIDKAIIVVPVATEVLPTDDVALQLATPRAPVLNKAVPDATQKANETMRTVCVGNVDKGLTSDQLKSIFEECGEVKNVQLSMDESQPTKFGFVEFASEASVEKAVHLSGLRVGSFDIKVDYSNAVVGQSQSASARVVQAALEKVAEVQEKIDGKDHDSGGRRWRRRRSSSRSRSRSPVGRYRSRYYRRSRSPRRHRSRSRSKDRDRRKSDRKRRHRSSSRSPRRGRRRSRSRSSRDGSRERKRRRSSSSPESSRNRDRKKHKKRRSRDRSRERSSKDKRRKGKDRSAEPQSGAEGKSKTKEKDADKERDKEKSDEEAPKVSESGGAPSGE
ncbi:serine/arginine-rich splicing factor 11-like [Oscarella lobularis]|uniref:serine/arginine-rich splicing factor 11-like n=1 Tax=Oscarella lobularis TaxID=121494 RepID=UPI003313E35C